MLGSCERGARCPSSCCFDSEFLIDYTKIVILPKCCYNKRDKRANSISLSLSQVHRQAKKGELGQEFVLVAVFTKERMELMWIVFCFIFKSIFQKMAFVALTVESLA